MSTDLALIRHVDEAAILRHLNLNPNDPATQALVLVCQRYQLDPVLKHVVLISGRPYITRDGLLDVAHRSGQLDGIVVETEDVTADEWTATVAVYRKDMSHPFRYRGRYPRTGQQKKYGPEMAVKVAEVMALRRAFQVTGIATAEEQWDGGPVDHVDPPVGPELVPVAHAKRLLLDACGGDRTLAVALWGDRDTITQPALEALLGEASAAIPSPGVAPDGLAREAQENVVDAFPLGEEVTGPPTNGADLGDSAGPVTSKPDPFDGLPAGDPPPWVDEDGVIDAEVVDDTPINQAQLQKLHALMREVHGLIGPQRHVWLASKLGRPIESTKDLTRDEASFVIDVLVNDQKAVAS